MCLTKWLLGSCLSKPPQFTCVSGLFGCSSPPALSLLMRYYYWARALNPERFNQTKLKKPTQLNLILITVQNIYIYIYVQMGLHQLMYREQHAWIWSVLGTQFLDKEWCALFKSATVWTALLSLDSVYWKVKPWFASRSI